MSHEMITSHISQISEPNILDKRQTVLNLTLLSCFPSFSSDKSKGMYQLLQFGVNSSVPPRPLLPLNRETRLYLVVNEPGGTRICT